MTTRRPAFSKKSRFSQSHFDANIQKPMFRRLSHLEKKKIVRTNLCSERDCDTTGTVPRLDEPQCERFAANAQI